MTDFRGGAAKRAGMSMSGRTRLVCAVRDRLNLAGPFGYENSTTSEPNNVLELALPEFRGRLSPRSFAKGFWALFLVGLLVSQLTPTQRLVGYPLNHWAALAYGLLAAWPWLALAIKRLHHSDRSIALAIPAMVALPAAEAAALASDYGGSMSCRPISAVRPVFSFFARGAC
jgi:hypothetical protein